MFLSAINHSHRVVPSIMLLALLFLSGCATVENNHDPVEGLNRTTYSFNEVLDRAALKPLAQGYQSATDPKMRKAVSNFYDNLTYPNTILNNFLQGKGTQGIEDILRFLINSTVGLAGLIDVATPLHLEKHNEDLGQTLGVWGFSQGAYIIYPFLGPNSVRNTPDFVTATATDGLFWASFVLAPHVTIPLALLKYVEQRERLLEASDMRDELALDPYMFTRESWRQNREYLVYDGNPPANKQMNGDDDWKNDEWAADDNDEGKDFAGAPQPESKISIQGALSGAAVAPAAASGSDILADVTDGQRLIINIASFVSEAEAAAAQKKLAKEHIRTGIKKVSVDARTWYRLYSSNRVRKADAQTKLAELKARSGYSDMWLEPVR
ncbi:MAG: VacJ family lipoprotein [Mariprofundaceae bacterium]|nr:VacJ family lipoprotein [Mariprofundaceae bacterium]